LEYTVRPFPKGRRVPLRRFLLSLTTTTAHQNVPRQIEKRIKMPTDAEPRSRRTPANQEYLDSLSARRLMEFRDYVRRHGVGLYSILMRQISFFLAPTSLITLPSSWTTTGWISTSSRSIYAAHTKIQCSTRR
jgi:hypothetical protein